MKITQTTIRTSALALALLGFAPAAWAQENRGPDGELRRRERPQDRMRELKEPAQAQAPAETDGLTRMADAKGAEYVEARQALITRVGVLAELDKTLEARWSDESFTKLAMATIARSHIARPDLVEKVNHLRGLDASFYKERRRPDPEASSELRRFGADAVGPMLELYLKTFDGYGFSKDDAEKAAKEKTALRVGIVIALSQSGHPSAFFVCREVARNASEEEGVRSQAIEGLGDIGTREAFAELTRIFADREGINENLRLAAVRGVGAVPSATALDFLKERLASENASERRTAVVSIGQLGSNWAWDARGEAAKATGDGIRRDAAAALVGAIGKLGEECGDQIIEALATVAHESSIELLTEKAAESATAKNALERVKIAVERNAPSKAR